MKAIINGRVLIPDRDGHFKIMSEHAVLYNEKIEDILPMRRFCQQQTEEILDAEGSYIGPGFINMHIHGCAGFDVMDNSHEALKNIGKYQAETGVTAFLPTTMTYDFPRIYKALDCINDFVKNDDGKGAAVLGCHMEGPFINSERKGAQAAEDIVTADFAKIEKYKDVIRMITIAPEMLHDDCTFVEQCRKNNIIVSIGHSSADYDTAVKAIKEQGITHVTHLFNAMTPLHHRKPGIAGAAMDTNAYCELIADNVHVHPALQRMLYRAKDKDRIILITDSMRACMLGDGESELGGQKVFVKGQKAVLADKTIAGSVLTMDRAIANFAVNNNAGLPEVIELATKNPAQELGMYDRIGSIEKGKQADIVVFGEDVRIKNVIIKGQLFC